MNTKRPQPRWSAIFGIPPQKYRIQNDQRQIGRAQSGKLTISLFLTFFKVDFVDFCLILKRLKDFFDHFDSAKFRDSIEFIYEAVAMPLFMAVYPCSGLICNWKSNRIVFNSNICRYLFGRKWRQVCVLCFHLFALCKHFQTCLKLFSMKSNLESICFPSIDKELTQNGSI